MIFIEESPREAKSFTDETSPRKPAASDRKVSIHGQVIKELPLDWYHDLMRLYPGERGEVKSVRILNEFHNLPREIQDNTWAGMKRVIINIVDSLSYQTDYKKILADVYKNDKAYELLRLHANQGKEVAKNILKVMDVTITEWIIRDSPPYRLKEIMCPRYFPGSLAFYMNQPQPYDDEVDLTPFKSKTSSMLGKAVKYSSKSGSVFFRAIDQIDGRQRYLGENWTQYRVNQVLRDSHAFDRGDDKAIKWIDNQRQDIAKGGLYNYRHNKFSFQTLYSVSSETSSHIQAADIAAGFARLAYERYGIVAVAGSFDYVTLNGERITQNDAEEKFELWRQLIEQEKRNSQAIILSN